MFKGASRFSQSRASSGRALSGYPKSRNIGSGTKPSSNQRQFEMGTAYVKRLSPLIRDYLKTGLGHSEIADELLRQRIATPSGGPWTAILAAELVEIVQLSDAKQMKFRRGRRKR
jgi:hypothetical protein